MKHACCVVALLLVLSNTFSYSQITKSPARDWKRLEFRVEPFTDLYFYVYKFASSSEKEVNVDGLAPAVEAARKSPFLPTTTIELVPFQSKTAADAAKAFGQYPETYKLKSGETVPLRERAAPLGQALTAIEKPFTENIWPQHKLLIEKSLAKVELTLGPKEEESFNYFTRHLGFEKAERIVPIFLVAETPWPGGFTMWGKDESRGVCLLSITALQGSELITAILHEVIHALDLETKGTGNVLVDLQARLVKAGFAADDIVVRHGPHMLVFIQSSETVRRHIDPSYQPYGEGVFVRPGLQPLVKVELPIWTEYLDGKISRDNALNKMVDAFVKARKNEAADLRK
jgi:hypothetical protein